MKFSVGYSVKASDTFLNELIRLKNQISEVYFSFGKTPSGRNDQTRIKGLTPWQAQAKQISDLTRLNKAGLKFNLLYNANCYGDGAQSKAFFNEVGETIDYFLTDLNLASVTTTSPLIAKFIKQNFSKIDVRASVNMGIGSVLGLEYVKDLFDSFYVKRELNRDFNALNILREWCNDNGKEMYLLANSGCLNDCSAHTFHDNLVAHEEGASKLDNGYQFTGVCKKYLANPNNLTALLTATNYIRPEDVYLYEGLIPAMKLATRVHENPTRILNAYAEKGKFVGDTTSLLEPNHKQVIYPYVLDNQKIKSSQVNGKLIYENADAFIKLEECYVDEQND